MVANNSVWFYGGYGIPEAEFPTPRMISFLSIFLIIFVLDAMGDLWKIDIGMLN